jgi:hypothetical protein
MHVNVKVISRDVLVAPHVTGKASQLK